jgi:proline iminopeptidase
MLHPDIQPYEQGQLDVGDGNLVHWEVCGNPGGKPAVVLHGGPGSGCAPWWRRLFDPEKYRVVLFDQRGCGRSVPHAGLPTTSLEKNTTAHLLGDIERLRQHVGVERWMVVGASWGSTLGLAYAQAHPSRVTEMVLFSVVTTTPREIAWLTRDVGRLFPEAWERFRAGVREIERDGDLGAAYDRLLNSPDLAIRIKAARDWCDWEDARHGADPRFDDSLFRLGFARLMTHYWRHAAWLQPGQLLAGAGALAGIPGVLIHGRLDVNAPLDVPRSLASAWRGSELVIVEGRGMAAAVVDAIDRCC